MGDEHSIIRNYEGDDSTTKKPDNRRIPLLSYSVIYLIIFEMALFYDDLKFWKFDSELIQKLFWKFAGDNNDDYACSFQQ